MHRPAGVEMCGCTCARYHKQQSHQLLMHPARLLFLLIVVCCAWALRIHARLAQVCSSTQFTHLMLLFLALGSTPYALRTGTAPIHHRKQRGRSDGAKQPQDSCQVKAAGADLIWGDPKRIFSVSLEPTGSSIACTRATQKSIPSCLLFGTGSPGLAGRHAC